MAANLLQVTVLSANAQEPIQDTFQNIWLLNKNRFLKAEASGADTRISYAKRFDQQADMVDILVDDTYATIKTGIITNGYTCGRKAEFTVLSYNGDDSGYPALKTLSIDNIIWVVKDLTDPTANSIILYVDPASMNPVPVKVLGDLAAIVTATTI